MLTINEFQEAALRLQSVIHTIPLSTSKTFSEMSGAEVYLKYENQQKTGSFKVRGAYNKIMKRYEEGGLRAVVASSAGNHAQGVAFAASRIGVPATIVMPRSTPIAKVSATQGYGAKVVLHGSIYDEAYAKAMEIMEAEGAEFIHPFNDEDVIAGQGTIALEILSDLPMVDMVFVPAGGGGLISGIAACLKQINPRIQVIGVQAEGARAIVDSFRQEAPQSSDTVHTIADGIAVKTPGDVTMGYINQYVDKMVTVTDGEIAEAILLLLERTKQVVEPAGASSLAAVLHSKVDIRGKKVCCVLSGGNIDVSFIHKVVERGLVTRGRHLKFSTVMPDVPGALERFAHIVAGQNANIILFQHDRVQADLDIGDAIIHVVCEVSGPEHAQSLLSLLKKEGYVILTDNTIHKK
jgi:threonine dehydratase